MSTEMPPDSLNIPPESIFAFRLMYAECSYGSMQHPLNGAEEGGGHGVLYGPEEQPLLNANDWVPNVNVIHFGDCSPKKLDENGDAIEEKVSTAVGQFIKDLISFINTGKCSPIIDKVWYETKKNYKIDGAPVLQVCSRLYCKRGGVIKIILQPADSADAESAEDQEEQADADEVMAATIAAVDQALAEGKISEETAEYLKAGYEAALNFADGDVSEANKLFNDLVRYGNHPAFGADPSTDYENAGPINEKFILYLKHIQSPLLSDCTSPINMTNVSTGQEVDLRDAALSIASNNQRIADTLGADGESVNPTISEYLGQLRADEEAKFTYVDDFGQTRPLPMPERLTAAPDPNNPFSFLGEQEVPRWYTDNNFSQTSIQIVDEAAGNPEQSVVVSILNGLS